MAWLEVALWGLAGGFVVDGLEFHQAVRRNGGTWPKEFATFGFFIGQIVRILSGAILAVAFNFSGQISGPIGALSIGAAAPLIASRLRDSLPK